LSRRPERRERPSGHLAWVVTPPPAIASYGGDDPPRHPGTRERTIQLLEVGITCPRAPRFIAQEPLEQFPDTQHGSPHRSYRLRLGGVERGVEKGEAGWELLWLRHVTNVIDFDGYVSPPPP
jgi:hypothetical protein